MPQDDSPTATCFRAIVTGLVLSTAAIATPAQAQAQHSFGFEPSEGFGLGTIEGQPAGQPWNVQTVAYDEEITDAGAHTGVQSLRFSNLVVNGNVASISSPGLSIAAGETGTVATGPIAAAPGIRRAIQTFWVRSVATSADPGLFVSVSIHDGTGGRQTFIYLDEQSGSLVLGMDHAIDAGTFIDTPALTIPWGAWYQVRVDLELIDGADNDVVRLYASPTNVDGTSAIATGGSWEGYYRDIAAAVPAVNGTSMRLNTSPGGGTPRGVYFDDLTLLLTGGADGGSVDAGIDGGQVDAGQTDGGSPDAGGADAGDGGEPDGGADAGVPLTMSVGCGCAHGPSALLLLAAIAAARMVRRTRRVSGRTSATSR